MEIVIKFCSKGSKWLISSCALVLALVWMTAYVDAARIKDITDIKGVRNNQLVGYGLVVGLDGTGDGKKTSFTLKTLANMLERMGMDVDPEEVKVKNVAAVVATAVLPPFARMGSRIDVLVSSIGDAKNLQGGTLILTPLKAADGLIYAVAQGPVSTGGFAAEGAGASVQKNFPTAGRLVNGAIIERELPSKFNRKGSITLALNNPDFTTATRVAVAINKLFNKERPARTIDAGTVEVRVLTPDKGGIVEFITALENLIVVPDAVSRVVINERTGTVVMGQNVRISTVAIAHGNLSLQISERPDVSQPAPFSSGETVVTPNTGIAVNEQNPPLFLVESGATIGDVVKALNAMGVSPRDLIAIFQALKSAGALHAKLDII